MTSDDFAVVQNVLTACGAIGRLARDALDRIEAERKAMLDVIEEAKGAVGWAEIEEHALGHSLAWADDLRAALARLKEMER